MSPFDTAMAACNAAILGSMGDAAVHYAGAVEQPHKANETWETVDVDDGSGTLRTVQEHRAWVRLSDFATRPAQGDRYVIGATDCKIRDVRTDGSGGAWLILGQRVAQ